MSMAEFEKKIRSVTDTPFGYTLSMIGGKWRLVLLYWLVEGRHITDNRTAKTGNGTCNAYLKDVFGFFLYLADNGYTEPLRVLAYNPQVPPKVEYSLTEKGASLYPIMEQMCQWGTEHSRDK